MVTNKEFFLIILLKIFADFQIWFEKKIKKIKNWLKKLNPFHLDLSDIGKMDGQQRI
jgi:hypothetical protein